MSTPDDLPWPELGNVSRGATRGNQGQKGVLGPADREGRCVLQLRVQPGVLAVRLNRQASDWYRTLDNEVNRALKMTKTYWRKARRRQDYDARADQDHMELHEWLQQLKDKTMSHLELLMQKGDIQGPPYTMPDDIELTFLRKFIERQAAGIPHNPRLRNSAGGEPSYVHRDHSVDSFTPEPSEQSFMDQSRQPNDHDSAAHMTHSRNSGSPSFRTPEGLAAEASSSKQALQAARASLMRAQKDTQEAFMRYTSCLDIERQARQAVSNAEKRRDDIMAILLSQNQVPLDARSRKSSVDGDDRRSPPRYQMEYQEVRNPVDPFMNARVPQKAMEWPIDGQGMYSNESVAHMEDQVRSRKHSRTWEHAPQMHVGAQDYSDYRTDRPYGPQDVAGLPPRKRIHHAMIPGFDVMNGAPLQTQNMTLQS
ncbi:hypothetical protein JR316_0013282 [Psilocybe cubensis]|uniref:Uncharacterized protein n=2 Tax=Psilocybe cubensis TaxID=181762 RepID=A0A8H7XRX6_PSICU|nr:hypothetical protein JR316_0013282 [Psilocybe cubensis]KAH9474816.1 hypothetical protein JR316_0013282 [Psilocybe cubensis]